MRVLLGTAAVGVLMGIQACDGGSTSTAARARSTGLPCSSSTAAGSALGGFYVQTQKGKAATTTTSGSSKGSKGSVEGGKGFPSMQRRGAVRVRGGAVVSDPYHARMQVMITRNMRKVLVEELDYLPDEVDDMDPQIAAVVIEKSLPRPRAGMPIVWRRSIRHKGSTPNPVSALTKALRGTVGGVLKGVVNVLAFPLKVVKGGRPLMSVVVAAAAVLALVAASAEDSSETGDREGASPGSAGLQLLEDKLGVAKALFRRLGGRAAEPEEVQKEEEKEDTKQGSRWGNKYFGKGLGGGDDSTASRPPPSSSSSSSSRGADSSGGVSRERKFREISDGAPRTDKGNGDDSKNNDSNYDNGDNRQEGQEQEDTRVEQNGRGGSAAIGKSNPGIGNTIGNEFGNGMGGLASGGGGGGARGAVGEISGEFNEQMAVPGAGGSGGGVERRRKKQQGRRDGGGETGGRREGYGGREEDGGEACPDAPAGPSTGSAVVFEELPPVMPAPSTIGVLDEDEEGGRVDDDRPRWGRKPMSEHIPDEEEMELWDSKIEASDTWLDRGINRAMTSVFGGGKGDSSSG